MKINLKIALASVVLLAAAGGAWLLWGSLRDNGLGEGFVSGNGRIEATEIAVATRLAGRVKDILVTEGQFVKAGQPLAHMEIESLQAQREEAEARLQQAKEAVSGAEMQVALRQSDHQATLALVVQGLLQVPIEGSLTLFFIGTALHLFATTSMGIFMATVARSMPQFGLLMILTLMPLQLLSGGMTPRESMPLWIQYLMSLAPTTHFTELSQAILYRGAGFEVVWRSYLALCVIGVALFSLSLARFRKTIAQMA